MKFYKAMRDGSKVEADGDLLERHGITFMLEIPEDGTNILVRWIFVELQKERRGCWWLRQNLNRRSFGL